MTPSSLIPIPSGPAPSGILISPFRPDDGAPPPAVTGAAFLAPFFSGAPPPAFFLPCTALLCRHPHKFQSFKRTDKTAFVVYLRLTRVLLYIPCACGCQPSHPRLCSFPLRWRRHCGRLAPPPRGRLGPPPGCPCRDRQHKFPGFPTRLGWHPQHFQSFAYNIIALHLNEFSGPPTLATRPDLVTYLGLGAHGHAWGGHPKHSQTYVQY